MNDILQKNLVATFGLDGLSDEEKAAFFDELGAVILETALVRFMGDLSDEQVMSLNYYLDTEPTQDALMEHLLTQYKGFEIELEKAMVEIKEDAVAVLGDPASDAASTGDANSSKSESVST